MYAILNISGKQYRVEPGSEIKVPHQKSEVGEKISYQEVLLLDDGTHVKIGTPFVSGATVESTVLEHGKDKKLIVFKKIKRKGFTSKNTHRQEFTRIKIEAIHSTESPESESAENKKTGTKKTGSKKSQPLQSEEKAVAEKE